MTTRTRVPKRNVPAAPVPWVSDQVVLDGETAYTTATPVQDALDDASAGSIITVGPGTYTETISGFSANVSLIGPGGRGATIDGEASGIALAVDADGVLVEGFAIRTDSGSGNPAGRVGAGLDGPELRDITVLQAGDRGIDSEGGAATVDATLSGIAVEESDGRGIDINGNDWKFHDITGGNSPTAAFSPDGSGHVGTLLDFGASVPGAGLRVDADDCAFSAVRAEGVGGDGVLFVGDDNAISAYRITGAGSDGIDDNGNRNMIGAGVVSGSTEDDIDAGGGTDTVVSSAAEFSSITRGTRTVVAGAGTEDLGTGATSAPTGAWPEGTTVRNSNADNDETWRLISGTWVQLA